jgi:polysaccharide biosynthesis protein PslH
MRILFISPRQCWPQTGGAKIREYHFARGLGERSSLSYVFFRDPTADLPTQRDLPFCEDIVPVAPPPAYSFDRLIRGIAGRWPLPVLNYTTAEMQAAIARFDKTKPIDAVHFDGTHMAAYTTLIKTLYPTAKIFFNWHNIESEGMHRFAELSPSLPKRLYANRTAKRLAAVEKGLLADGYGNIVCSERERNKLNSLAPKGRVAVIENGVDTQYFKNAAASINRTRILFVGLMAYHANVDAAVWFTKDIWPRLHSLMPDKTLTIVGANPTAAVLALRNEPGVEVTGTVPDVRPYYAEAFAAIAPLRTGAGTRLKILEGMAAGAPVVSTALGAEGLDCSPGKDILLAENAEDWAQAFTQLGDERRREDLVRAGLELVRSRYDWAILRESLYQTYVRMMKGDS